MNYGKSRLQRNGRTDFPFFHDGKARQSSFIRVLFVSLDSTLHRSNLSGCGVIQGCN